MASVVTPVLHALWQCDLDLAPSPIKRWNLIHVSGVGAGLNNALITNTMWRK